MKTLTTCRRVRLQVRGTVQGVGFRPFVYRLAHELGCAGWVANDSAGVIIEAEAVEPVLRRLQERLQRELPPHAGIVALSAQWLEPTGEPGFRIEHSDGAGERRALVLPDIATCADCLQDIRDPAGRRRGYAFTNCTHCGPRFTIIRALPYDRHHTTMAAFDLCADCRREYHDPADRRFHAQPNACPVCGPRLRWLDRTGRTLPGGCADDQAVQSAAAAIARGELVAVKGIGGYLLVCDATNPAAVQTLRARKRRPTRPLAIMVADLAAAAELVLVDAPAAALLAAASAPIVLLPRLNDAPICADVAPGNPDLGVMLPYAPLLHLLMAQVGGPIVATSGNLSEEPICTDDADALDRLGDIAEAFLVHDRPIQRHVDDSVAWIVAGEARLLRRARGYAPLPVTLPQPVPPLLAVGGHLKNVIAVARDHDVFLSQHIGDLETHEAQHAFVRVIEDLLGFYHIQPVALAHDLHPDYASTRWAMAAASAFGSSAPLIAVQHHHAHLAACLAEHGCTESALGMVWDGTGLGPDGSIWGGEFLLGDASAYQRVGHLRPFQLPGGEAAIHEPVRIALALLHQLEGEPVLDSDLPAIREIPPSQRGLLHRMLTGSVHSPWTSSAGRLFDAVAALLQLVGAVTYEGEAAMALEFAARAAPHEPAAYPLPLADDGTLDWRTLLAALVAELRAGVARECIAARFHNGLMAAAVTVAARVGCPRVVLSGGCFQNRVLAERLPPLLRARGFEVLQHRLVPAGDGGIALGQIAIAAAWLRQQEV